MDVLSLEHYFGKEVETSLRQMFNYFCNHINLGQWTAAKACLIQLESNKKNIDFDYSSVRTEIMKNPELYNYGSCSLESPYHLSLLLYEFCVQNGFMENRGELFYDKMLFKFLMYSSLIEINKEPSNGQNHQPIIDELIKIIWPNEGQSNSDASKFATDKEEEESSEFSRSTNEFFKQLFIIQPKKAISMIELINRYNKNIRYNILKVHLDAIYSLLEQIESANLSYQARQETKSSIFGLINLLSAYELKENSNTAENNYYESLALVQRCFKEICFRFNAIWAHNLDELEETFYQLYSRLLFDFEESSSGSNEESTAVNESINIAYLFSKIHYEVEKQITIIETFQDESLIVLSIIKRYTSSARKDFLWRRLFLFCYCENKLLLKTLIDECLLVISRGQLEHLNLLFGVKEFLNLKPLILLLGISKANDVQSAKKLLAMMCLNHEKGTLCEKIGNILKTHLDFIAWFQQVNEDARKKEISFAELIKLLHRQLPLNIISQHIDLAQTDPAEITKVLRNTLMDKQSGSKTKWVRFVDEVNEKILQIQETCLAIYNGFYCLNEVLNTVLYTCEHLNSKIYSNLRPISLAASKKSTAAAANLDDTTVGQSQTKQQAKLERIQSEYTKNVVQKLDLVKKTLNQIVPVQFRIEIIENMYSLLFLSSNDLKESEDEEEEDEEEEGVTKIGNDASDEEEMEPREKTANQATRTISKEAESGGGGLESFEILSEEWIGATNANAGLPKLKVNDDREYSIYDLASPNSVVRQESRTSNQMTNHSSKSTLGSYSSYASNESQRYYRKYSSGHAAGNNSVGTNEDDNYFTSRKTKSNIYRRNAGGGGSFLVNDFLCRDLLLLLKEAVQIPQPQQQQQQQQQLQPHSNDPTTTRLSKIQKLINETFWRFQVIKPEQILLDYGRISNLVSSANNSSPDSPSLINDTHHIIIYDIIKKRKRSGSSGSSHPFVESLNISTTKSNQSKATEQQPISLALNKMRTLTGGTVPTTDMSSKRRSVESQRSLSLIYPINRYKRSNQTIMKLLSDVPTLAVICLKEKKFADADQLLKMYSSASLPSLSLNDVAQNNRFSANFELDQIEFHSAYENSLKELRRIEETRSSQMKQNDSSLIEDSLLSLEILKSIQPILDVAKDDNLLQSIVLCDTAASSNFGLNISLALVEHSKVYLNSIQASQTGVDEANKNATESDELKDSSGLQKEIEINKFKVEMRDRLDRFDSSVKEICHHFIEQHQQQQVKRMNEYLYTLDGICFSLGEVSKEGIDHHHHDKHLRSSPNKLFKNIHVSIEKYESFAQLKKLLNDAKSNFELAQSRSFEATVESDIYFSIMSLLNECIRLSDNEDLISSFLYKSTKSATDHHDSVSDRFSASLRTESLSLYGSQNSLVTSLGKTASSNYLLSFYEYCKTLYEYFREKSGPATLKTVENASCFSILNYSPASLICKLLFVDGIKPVLIESLTQKLNLNLTAIILHNSCPRLKLTLGVSSAAAAQFRAASFLLIPQLSHQSNRSEPGKELKSSTAYMKQISTASNGAERKLTILNTNQSCPSDAEIYNLGEFYLVLNQSEVTCCSRKKPDEFVRDLLLKVLKYCKSFLSRTKSNEENSAANVINSGSDAKSAHNSAHQHFVDVKTAQEIYQCAEFKAILNESQELQHLNLYLLKTDAQKLSFFINLHNLLCIHAYFFLASLNSSSKYSEKKKSRKNNLPNRNLILNEPSENSSLLNESNEYIFKNKTEELLFRQKASYRVGQMGYVSLYDLKYHILNRRCLDNDTVPASINSSKSLSSPLSPVPATRQQQAAATTKSASLLNRIGGGLAKATGGNNTPSSQKTAQQQFSGSSFKSNSQDLSLNSSFDCKKLYKSAFYAIDLNAEPLWTPFMPSERILDYHILFALINCVESDPPICVYNSDDMLADQLEMQMRLFLTDSIYADLCDDILYIPSLLIENCSWFIQSPNSPSSESNVSSNTKLLHQSSTISNSNETTITLSTSPPQSTSPSTSNVQRSDMESLVWFLKDHVSQELKDGLKCLLDLDSIDAFGENIDEFGRKELPFPVVMIAASSRFSLIIDYEYSAQPVYEMTKNFAATNSDVVSAGDAFNCLWFKKEICKTVILYEQKKLMARRSLGTVSATNLEATKESNAEESGVQSGSDESQSNNQEESSNSSEKESPNKNEAENKASQSQLNSDCLEYIQKNSILISNSLSFLFDVNKRDTFFKSLSDLSGNEDAAAMSNNPLNRFIQLYVPLEYMKHMGVESKLNMITQFLLTNKTDESKIEMIIDLANYYSQKQEWRVVLDLLNACMHDSEDLMSDFTLRPAAEFLSFPASDNLKEFGVNKHFSFTDASNSKLSQRDLYNLFDHACVCLANSEAKKNEKSYTYLFKMKNFLRQVRAIFGLMHLWPIDGCLEMIEYCIAKARLVEYPTTTNTNTNTNNTTTSAEPPNPTTNPQQVKKQISVTNGDSWLSSNMACSNSDITIANRLSSTDYLEQMVEMHRNLTMILTNKKNELMAYKELTRCARITLEKYYEHQQFQDAAGFYKSDNQGPSSTNMNKMKKVCQKCLTWQFAKNQLESSSSSDDEETNELIMDLFLMNDQFTSAKYLIRKLNLPQKLQFKLDMGHLKHRLLNLNAASSIIVIDLEFILKECIAFGADGDNKSASLTDSSYVFNICFKLLNEFKDLNELNNQVLISLCEFLLTNYREMLSSQQTKELKILEETARTFQILVQHESLLPFEAYKRHHSQPELIIEQLLMNSHIELASRVLKILRDGLNDADFSIRINEMLVKYARKALELKGLCRQEAVATGQKQQQAGGESGFDGTSKRLSLAIPTSSSSQKLSAAAQKARKQSHPMMEQFSGNASLSPNINIIASSSPSSSVSSSFKNFYRFGAPSSSSAIQPNLASLQLSPNSSSVNMAGGNTSMSSSLGSSFVMPAQVPSKEEWVRDDEVNECMVCGVVKFSLLNRRHHCRRCGRVVCAGCSQKLTLIDNVSRRTCDDCFRQIEAQKINEQVRLLDTLNESLDETSSLSGGMLGSFRRRTKIHRSPKTKVDDVGSINDETTNTTAGGAVESSVYWQLMGGSVDNELSLKRDEEIRQSFRYQQSPSTSLCLSILDLHDNALECGKHLLSMCDDLSAYLQTANSQVEDVGLIINMCKYLLHNAKVKLLQNVSTSSIISLCDSYLSLVDVVEQLLMANCSNIPSLNELRNTESARRVRNRLLEEERHELAMNLSTKCGLDTQTVWASWGMIELRRGQYKEARTKFDKCLKQQAADKANVSIGSTQLKILNDIVACLENTPPIRMLGPQTLLAPLRSVESLIAEPKLFSIGESNLDEIQLKESIYYLETYGNYNLIVAFYQRHGYLESALQYLLDKKCSAEVFTESVLVASIRNGEFYRLLEYMLSLERYQYKLHSYYAAIGKYLEKNSYLNTLYDFQILMKDYVRACMSCICFFLRNCNNYSELYENVHYLNKASKHLEQYLEVSSTKQTTQPNVQTQFAWKSKSDQQNLCKQISTPEVDNYLKAIKLQIEVTKFINNCIQNKKDQINSYKTPTLFGNNDAKIKLCCLILLSGQSIQEGFGFVVRIKQCFNLNPTLVYSEIARELAKQYNFKEIHNLLKCINESGYKEEINASYDECISTCIRVFAASTTQPSAANLSQQQQQQLAAQNKEIEELIQLIKDDENKINAYILNGRLKSAYLIAIKIDRADIVKHISNVAERMGQNLIKDICVKWLEKKANTK